VQAVQQQYDLDHDTPPHSLIQNNSGSQKNISGAMEDQLLPAASCQNFPFLKPSSKHQAAKQGVHFILETTKQPANSQQTEMLLTDVNANVKLAPA
jgi:hypothetical protein